MIRRIIEIDEERCTGCGLCAKACHEGAIAMVNGKATLARAVETALAASGRDIPLRVVILTPSGEEVA